MAPRALLAIVAVVSPEASRLMVAKTVPSAGQPTLEEEWRSEGLDTKQAYFWHRDAASHGNVAVAFIHGIFSTALDDQLTDQLFGALLDWGYPVCSFDAADHGNTRFLNEFAGQPEDQVRCSKNAGFNLTAEKGLEYDRRYVEPVRRFPAACAKRFEHLLGKSDMKIVLFGHSWGGKLTTVSLQTTPAGGPDTSRVVAAVTADMGLDTRKFEKGLLRKGRDLLFRLHGSGVLPSNLPIGGGFSHNDTYLKEFDPPRRRVSPCPAVEDDEARTASLGFLVKAFERVEGVVWPASGSYPAGIPTLHEYCSEDQTIVPRYIELAGRAQGRDAHAPPICLLDVAQFGRCSHVSFPGRTTGWDELNTPWKALEAWLSSAAAARDEPAAFGATCPGGAVLATGETWVQHGEKDSMCSNGWVHHAASDEECRRKAEQKGSMYYSFTKGRSAGRCKFPRECKLKKTTRMNWITYKWQELTGKGLTATQEPTTTLGPETTPR